MTDKQAVKFGDICKEVKLTTKDPIGDGYERYIGLEHLDSGSLKIKRWGIIAEDNPSFTRVFKKGHILFGKRRPYLKKAAIAEFDGICSGDIIVMESTQELIVSELLPFIVQSDKFWDWAIKTSSGSLSPRTKFSALKTCELSIPHDLDSQNKLHELLTQSQKVVSETEDVLNSATSAEKVMAASWFSTTNRNISHSKLSNFANHKGLQTGPFGSQLHASEYSKEGIPVIMPKELGYGDIDVNSSAKVPLETADRLTRHRLEEGDFIFGRRGDIGRFGYITKELEGAVCGTGCLRFRPKDKTLAAFYRAFFRSDSAIRWLNQNAVGMTMLNLNTEILGDLPVPIMNKSEYEKVALIFESMLEHKEALLRSLDANKKLMNAIING